MDGGFGRVLDRSPSALTWLCLRNGTETCRTLSLDLPGSWAPRPPQAAGPNAARSASIACTQATSWFEFPMVGDASSHRLRLIRAPSRASWIEALESACRSAEQSVDSLWERSTEITLEQEGDPCDA